MIARAVVLAVVLAGCAAQPAASPVPIATVAVASPTQTPTPTTPPRTASPPPTPTATLIALPSFAALSAASGTVLWALVAGTRLFRSTDRGDSWTERPLPPRAPNAEIAFVDDHEGWVALAGPAATQCQSQTVTFAHTADAGGTWQSLAPSGIAAAQCKERLVFSDGLHGFLNGWDPNAPPVVYRTADGGKTWSASRPLADPPGFVTKGAGITLRPGTVRTFGGLALVEAVGITEDQQQQEHHYVFASTDGGATWTYRAVAPDPQSAVVFVAADRWLQIAPPDASRETTDGGASWHPYTTTYQQAAPIAPAIVFGDAQTGYATVRGAIQRTVDGGAHWSTIRTPGTF